MANTKIKTKTTWLPKCDLEDFGQYLFRFKEIRYGTLDWQKPSFVEFCKRNKIQPKGTSAKKKQLNHFWFSTNIPKGESVNDIAYHFLRHIRNAFAHCNINVVIEGKKHHKYYVLEDYEINKSKSMSGKIRSDLMWNMINTLLSSVDPQNTNI